MSEIFELKANTPELINAVIEALEDYNKEVLNEIFSDLEAGEIAHLLESLPDSLRSQLWGFIPEDRNGDVLFELGDVARSSLANNLEHARS